MKPSLANHIEEPKYYLIQWKDMIFNKLQVSIEYVTRPELLQLCKQRIFELKVTPLP